MRTGQRPRRYTTARDAPRASPRLAKLRVQALSTEPRREPVLGEATSDDDGAFAIQVPALKTDVVFRVFRGETLLVNTSGTVVWNHRTNSKPVVIPVPEAEPEPEP